MRFKIFFNDQKQELDINCLKDAHSDTILPENPDQHVYFPIPNDLRAEIKEYLMPIIDDELVDKYNEITDEIQKLTNARRSMINELRTKLNPSIIDKCEEFKYENAEWFV